MDIFNTEKLDQFINGCYFFIPAHVELPPKQANKIWDAFMEAYPLESEMRTQLMELRNILKNVKNYYRLEYVNQCFANCVALFKLFKDRNSKLKQFQPTKELLESRLALFDEKSLVSYWVYFLKFAQDSFNWEVNVKESLKTLPKGIEHVLKRVGK